MAGLCESRSKISEIRGEGPNWVFFIFRYFLRIKQISWSASFTFPPRNHLEAHAEAGRARLVDRFCLCLLAPFRRALAVGVNWGAKLQSYLPYQTGRTKRT